MKPLVRGIASVVFLLFAVSLFAAVSQVTVPQGTNVVLVFDQALSSKTAKVGQPIRLHVRNDVMIGNHKIIAKGAKVNGIISKADKAKRYGVNAKIKVALNPVKSLYNRTIPLEPRSTGKYVSGEKSGKAAAATAGGAVVAGPVGLVGGYFVHGKPVNIKAGDLLDTQVSKAIVLRK